jgi:hypothetical protein
LEEDQDSTTIFIIKNTDLGSAVNDIEFIVVPHLRSSTDVPSNDVGKWIRENQDQSAYFQIPTIAANSTTAVYYNRTGGKSRIYLTAYVEDWTNNVPVRVSSSYTLEVDRFKDTDGTINRDKIVNQMFVGGNSSLGVRNDVLYIKGDEIFDNNDTDSFTIPFILNQENFDKIDAEYFYMHYESSSYTYGVTDVPDRSSPSLQIKSQNSISAKTGYSPIIGKSNIAMSYYRNPLDQRTITSTVRDVIDRIPYLTHLTTTASVYEFTLPLGLTRGMNQYYSDVIRDITFLVNAEYWQSTTRGARTGASSLVPYFYFQPIEYTTTVAHSFNADNTTTPDSSYYIITADLHNSVETSDKFYNVVEVYGGEDENEMPLYHKCRDKYSVDTYGTTLLSVTNNDINSYEEVVDYARDLLLKGSRGRVKGTIMVSGDWQHLHSKMIGFNDTRNGWVDETLMVRSTRYTLSENYTELSVNNDYLDPNTVLDSFLFNIKNTQRFVSPNTNEEVKFISAMTEINTSTTGGNTYYLALLTSSNTADELTGGGYERKAIVTSTIHEPYFDYVHTKAIWQQYDGHTEVGSPITHVVLFDSFTDGTTVSSTIPVDGGYQYKWRSTQLYVSLCISTT